MDLQGDIDALLRDSHPSPFRSEKFKNVRPEELQRLVMMTAIQFVLFEPDDWVEGNDEFKVAAEKLIEVTSSSWLGSKRSIAKDRIKPSGDCRVTFVEDERMIDPTRRAADWVKNEENELR